MTWQQQLVLGEDGKKARKFSKAYEYTCKLALQELFPFHEQEPPA